MIKNGRAISFLIMTMGSLDFSARHTPIMLPIPLRVAFVAYVVTIFADCLAVLFFVTDSTFHQPIIF